MTRTEWPCHRPTTIHFAALTHQTLHSLRKNDVSLVSQRWKVAEFRAIQRTTMFHRVFHSVP
jgi:hypothetical protein